MKKKVKAKVKKDSQPDVSSIPKKVQGEAPEQSEFDFGGLPEKVPFKRNIGCGG